MYKEQEIREYARERVEDIANYSNECLEDITDLHHDIFNTDYYIVGRYQATQWLGTEAFNCIGVIKEYEESNFGEVYTDLSEPERVVNMYVYIVGEQILEEVVQEYLAAQQLKLDVA